MGGLLGKFVMKEKDGLRFHWIKIWVEYKHCETSHRLRPNIIILRNDGIKH